MTSYEVREEQQKDRELQLVMEWLDKKERWPEELLKIQLSQSELYVMGGSLMKQEKLVLPTTLRERAVSLAHQSHPGMSTMKNYQRQGLWWPNMFCVLLYYIIFIPITTITLIRGIALWDTRNNLYRQR